MLRLRSLGQTLIEADDARLTPAAVTVFATALYLIVETGRRVEREELTHMLWPGVSEAQAQHGLRQALYKLKTLGAAIKADRSALILSPRFCTTDFASLLEPQTPSSLEALADTIGGSFLPGYRPELSEEFATWVERQRDVVHSAVARALMAGMQAKKRQSDWNGAERLAAMCLTIDPLNEEATLTVAEAAALGGSKTKALSILNHYLEDIGENAGEIKLPAVLLRRRISEAYQDNVFPVRDAPFVGREEEMAELTRALARAQSGQGSAYVIWGEPGIGKTRLVSEFTRVASLQPVHIVRVACQSHDVRRPLSVFVDMVPKLLALPGALGCSPESMMYLRRLTALDPDQERLREEQEQSDISYHSARNAILDILDAIVAESCCLITMEDAHWLDPASTRIVEALGDWMVSSRLMLVLTSRTIVRASEHVFNLSLHPLTADASSVVANALVGNDRKNGDQFRSWCIASSGGNPYYLIELLRNSALSEDGYQAPASLSRLLQTRVRNLSSAARSLLEVCCVLGTHSTFHRVESCIELSRTETLAALNELDATGMISVDGAAVLSRHDLLSTAVLALMTPSVRIMIERYVASQLELEAHGNHSVSLMWESAEHWLSSRDTSRAIQLLRRCGNYLMDVGLPEEAAQVLERAQGLSRSPEGRYDIGAERSRALMRAERHVDAACVLRELLLIRSTLQPRPSLLDEVGVMSIQARWEIGDAIPQLAEDSLLALSALDAPLQERVSIAGWLLTAADNMCDIQLGQRVYAQVAEYLHSPTVANEMRLWIEMIYHCSVGDGSSARELADELAEYSLLNCPPIVAIRYLRHASHVHCCHGTCERALTLAIKSFEVAKSIKASRVIEASAVHMGAIHLHIGDTNEARHWLSRVEYPYAPGNYAVADVNCWSYLTELAIREGDVASAAKYLSYCLPAAEKTQSMRAYTRDMSLRTQLSVLQGQPLTSLALESFIDMFDRIKCSICLDYPVESLTRGLLLAGREDDARRILGNFLYCYRRDQARPSPFLMALVDQLFGPAFSWAS